MCLQHPNGKEAISAIAEELFTQRERPCNHILTGGRGATLISFGFVGPIWWLSSTKAIVADLSTT
jgi:hypothetical protein